MSDKLEVTCARCGLKGCIEVRGDQPWYCGQCSEDRRYIEDCYRRGVVLMHYKLYEQRSDVDRGVQPRNVSMEMPNHLLYPKVLQVLARPSQVLTLAELDATPVPVANVLTYDLQEEWLNGRPYRRYYLRRRNM